MILFTPTALQKIKKYTLTVDGEISGLGKSKMLKGGTILITDIIILEQVNTSASTDLNEESMAKFLNEKMKNGEEIENWNVWWHSHDKFNVFWSSTDEDTIENTTGGPYLISIVINKEMEVLGRLDIFQPVRLTCNLEVSKSKGRPRKIKEYLEKICQKQIDKCVSKPIDIYDSMIYLTPLGFKNQSPSSEQETLDRWWPMA
jgi:hypothetical protein